MVLLVKQVHLQKDVAAMREGSSQRRMETATMGHGVDGQAASVNWMIDNKTTTTKTSLVVRDIMWFLSCVISGDGQPENPET
jgi:hypothetical protein